MNGQHAHDPPSPRAKYLMTSVSVKPSPRERKPPPPMFLLFPHEPRDVLHPKHCTDDASSSATSERDHKIDDPRIPRWAGVKVDVWVSVVRK